MINNSQNIIDRLRRELDAALKTIESLKKHQVTVRSTAYETPGAFEKLIQLEKLVEKRTEELLKSREEVEDANTNLEKLVMERTRRLSVGSCRHLSKPSCSYANRGSIASLLRNPNSISGCSREFPSSTRRAQQSPR